MTRLSRILARTALAATLGAAFGTAFTAPATAQGTAIEAASTRGSTLFGNDRPGPWGDSAYTFALKVSTSIYKTVNLHRKKKGLGELQADPGLGVVAGAYSGDMITGDFFGHFAPDGRDLGARLAEANLGHYDKVAEILWDASDANIDWRIEETVRSSVTDWLRSPEGHREALLDPEARIVGIGTAIRDERIVITMLLGDQ